MMRPVGTMLQKMSVLMAYWKNSIRISLNLVLQNTQQKTIVESSYDRKWGTGVPLHSPDALNSEYWTGDNLLGKILSIVMDTLRSQDDVD